MCLRAGCGRRLAALGQITCVNPQTGKQPHCATFLVKVVSSCVDTLWAACFLTRPHLPVPFAEGTRLLTLVVMTAGSERSSKYWPQALMVAPN